ncbi:glycosyltransferase family 4 protein [Caldifermentibacillus hisashii]|uniref:glycosyltransferase family 4 protein n=1 Tax=Caldifermentibacillus hisashii TaxID=996558 RepID=UPI003136A163
MRILFLTTLLPYPLNNGGKIKTFYTLKALSADHEVDVLCFINNKKDNVYKKNISKVCNQIDIVEKVLIAKYSKKSLFQDFTRSLFTKYPYVIYKFYSKEMAKKIIELQKNYSYDLIYVDHLPMMIYHNLFNSPVILDEHNVESLIMKRFYEVEKNFIKKIIGYIEYKKLLSFEKFALNRVDRIISLSLQDKQELERLSGSDKPIDVIPICIESNYVKGQIHRQEGEKLKILFVGTMSWYPNSHGLTWFIEEVFSKLDENKFELYVVGGNPPASITKWNEKSNIHIVGYVTDVNQYIDICHVNVVPIFIGSGLRVKIIEAYSKGIPTISTSIGAEGIEVRNGENIIIANEPEEFISSLNELYNNMSLLNHIKNEALKTYETHYSVSVLAHKLNQIISLQTK